MWHRGRGAQRGSRKGDLAVGTLFLTLAGCPVEERLFQGHQSRERCREMQLSPGTIHLST